MKYEEAKAQYEGLRDLMDKVVDRLEKARKHEADAKVAASNADMESNMAQERLKTKHRERSVILSQSPEFKKESRSRLDSDTGEPTSEWEQLVMDKMLHQDDEFIRVLGEFYEKQEALKEAKNDLYRADADVRNLYDRLGVAKNQGIVLAAIIRLASAEG